MKNANKENKMTLPTPVADAELWRATIIKHAEEAMAQYPQYKGMWNNHKLAIVTKDIKTKLGMAFRAGDMVIAQDSTVGLDAKYHEEHKDFVTVWSMRNRCNTSINKKKINWVVVS